MLLCYHSVIKRKANNVPRRHRTYIRRSEDVLDVRTSSKRLMYVQFTSHVYGVYSGLFITFELLIGDVLKFHCCPSCSTSVAKSIILLLWSGDKDSTKIYSAIVLVEELILEMINYY